MATYPYYSSQVYGAQQQPQPQYYRPQPYGEQTQIPQVGIKGRPVSSIDEVRATSIDFDGSIFFFPDLANKKIYTKQINLDGTSTLNIYELKAMPIEATAQYVTKDEFDSALAEIKASLNEKKGTPKQESPQIKF